MAAAAARVVVAGGTGFVGGEVVRTFERLGYETFVISRRDAPKANTPSILTSNGPEFKNSRTWTDIEVTIVIKNLNVLFGYVVP